VMPINAPSRRRGPRKCFAEAADSDTQMLV
jgi:hypothetical protein